MTKQENDTRRLKQTTNIIMITFWSQFSSYSLNTILVLFLTKPLITNGLGYKQATAYAFIGISQATGYMMPILGGYMADHILGIRRSILLGSVFLAIGYLLVMLSGYTVSSYGNTLFIAAYALIPASNSLLAGTASTMVNHIHSDSAIKAKSAMTYYYMSINIGALLATIIAPQLFESKYGPLSVLTLTFVGKAIAALNFSYQYKIYDNVTWGKDTEKLSSKAKYQLIGYLAGVYFFTLFAYSHIRVATSLISIGCVVGIIWFLIRTLKLNTKPRLKQLIAFILIIESIVFFIIYNQMNTTLILFAKNNSNYNLFGLTISPAQYQMLNPILIISIGLQLPRLYRALPKFTVPYQFACGTLISGFALLYMSHACSQAINGIVDGNNIAITYILITIGELWVSAIGLSMIGMYCDQRNLAFAMGVWLLGSSLSNTISGRVASYVAIPEYITSKIDSLSIYRSYYESMGLITCTAGVVMVCIAIALKKFMAKRNIEIT
ncbi:MAG: oligopeptide:H+ symporter [Legionellaceae bacterium]|nr:oligopeptide:H+ symporter [Legionellaceae bacterium]